MEITSKHQARTWLKPSRITKPNQARTYRAYRPVRISVMSWVRYVRTQVSVAPLVVYQGGTYPRYALQQAEIHTQSKPLWPCTEACVGACLHTASSTHMYVACRSPVGPPRCIAERCSIASPPTPLAPEPRDSGGFSTGPRLASLAELATNKSSLVDGALSGP